MTFDILKGLKRGMNYGEAVSYVGSMLLHLIGLITIYAFWAFVAIYYRDPFFSVAVLIIKITRMGLILFIFGVLFYYLCFFIHELVYKKKMKQEEQHVTDAINSKTINKLLETD